MMPLLVSFVLENKDVLALTVLVLAFLVVIFPSEWPR